MHIFRFDDNLMLKRMNVTNALFECEKDMSERYQKGEDEKGYEDEKSSSHKLREATLNELFSC
jgi:hypothetical protein